jgi:SAM-dependent methyltransferase
VELSDTNDVRTLTVLSVPAGARVLDLGGGGGPAVAEALAERGCTVSLVAADERTVRELGRHCAQTLVADLDSIELRTAFGDAAFEAVLAMGTLQHVRAPAAILRQVAALLPPSGRLIAALSNVAHGAVRLELLRGRFRAPGCDSRGREPLHVFDGPAARLLLEEAGLLVVEQLKVTRLLHETEAKLDPSTFPDDVLAEVAADPDSLVSEFVLVASPAGSGASLPSESTLAEHLQARAEELAAAGTAARARIGSLEEHVAELNQRIDELSGQAARAAELAAVLDGKEDELAALRRDREHLELDVAVKDAYITELRIKMSEVESERALVQDRLERELMQAQLALAQVQGSLAAEAEEAAHLRARAAELDLLHHRVATKTNRLLLRVPGVHRALRAAMGRVARRRPPTA